MAIPCGIGRALRCLRPGFFNANDAMHNWTVIESRWILFEVSGICGKPVQEVYRAAGALSIGDYRFGHAGMRGQNGCHPDCGGAILQQ